MRLACAQDRRESKTFTCHGRVEVPCGMQGHLHDGGGLAPQLTACCLSFCSGSCPWGVWRHTLRVFILKSPTLTSPLSLSKPEIFTGPLD